MLGMSGAKELIRTIDQVPPKFRARTLRERYIAGGFNNGWFRDSSVITLLGYFTFDAGHAARYDGLQNICGDGSVVFGELLCQGKYVGFMYGHNRYQFLEWSERR